MLDKLPKGNRHDAALPSGEVFVEYGIVDLNHSFPAERKHWTPEMSNTKQEHLVVPFRVVHRGFKQLASATRMENKLERQEGGDYKVVILSDTR